MPEQIESSHEPVRPVDQPQAQVNQSRFGGASEGITEYLLGIDRDIEASDREKRLTLYRQQLKAHKYFDGNFHGYVDENCEWQQDVKAPNEVWYDDNQLYQYLRTALMELSRTGTKVQVAAANDTDEDQAAAKLAQSRYDANRDATFDSHKKQTKNTYALLNGIVIVYTFPDFDCKGRKEQVPDVLKQDAETDEQKYCANCIKPIKLKEEPEFTAADLGEEGGSAPAPDENESCPHCGSTVFSMISSPKSSDTVIGYKDVKQMRNNWIVPNPISIIVSMQASRITESPFLKWKQLVLRSVLENKFDGVSLPSTGTESLELRYITNQQLSTPAGGSSVTGIESPYSNSRELEVLEFHQDWLDYSVYGNKTFDSDQELTGGKTLKAGEKLGILYPDGLYFAKVGNLIVDMWNEDKNRKWTSSPYSLRAGSMYGHGISPVFTDVELLNDQMKLVMANMWSNGAGREFVDSGVIPELSADPTIPTYVNNPDGRNLIGGAYAVTPPINLSSEVYAMRESRGRTMQGKIGALSLGGSGAADLQDIGTTATAIATARDMAVGRFAPDLELMADSIDREQAIQFLLNEQEYFTPQQWKQVQGEYGEAAVKRLLEMDIRRDLLVTIVPGSYMPKSDAQRLAKTVEALQYLPVVIQSGNPELISYAFEEFGLPESLGGYDAPRHRVDKILGRFSTACEWFIEAYGDSPTTDLSDPQLQQAIALINNGVKMPVDMLLDNHDAMIDGYRDWRYTDEGTDASNLLTATVANRIKQHETAKTNLMQMKAQQQIDAQKPIQDAQAQQAAAQQQSAAQSQQGSEAQQNDQTALQIADKASTLQDNQDQRTHEASEADKQRQHEKDIKQMDIQAQQQQNAGSPQQTTLG